MFTYKQVAGRAISLFLALLVLILGQSTSAHAIGASVSLSGFQERLAKADSSVVLNVPETLTTAAKVAGVLNNSESTQADIDSLSDEAIADFKAVYIPYGNPVLTATSHALLPQGRALAANKCYSSSNTYTHYDTLGMPLFSTTVAGTWCTNSAGSAIVSTPAVSSWYATYANALFLSITGVQSPVAFFTSTQATFRAGYQVSTVVSGLQLDNYTVCSKLYGNRAGDSSGSGSCS